MQQRRTKLLDGNLELIASGFYSLGLAAQPRSLSSLQLYVYGLAWRFQMFYLSLNLNDVLIFTLATSLTSAFGSPVVLAAIFSGIFVVAAKLIEVRAKRKRDAEWAQLITTQNELLRQVVGYRTEIRPSTLARDIVLPSK